MNLPMPGPPILLLLALLAALAWGLYWHWRLGHERRRVEALVAALERVPPGGQLEVNSTTPGVLALTRTVNQALSRVTRAQSLASGDARQLFSLLGDRIHEAVLVHSDVILYANRQFARLVGVERDALLGRKLSQLVPAEQVELVADNIRRRLAGEPAAERYEVDVAGQGQQTRLELSSAVIGYGPGTALLITGVEVIPTQSLPALMPAGVVSAVSADLTLAALPVAVVITDGAGLITYANPAAEHLLGEVAERLERRRLENVITLVDETDQRLLLDPVRQALKSGASVSLAPRALLLSRADGSERSIELAAAPIRQDDTVLAGAVVLLHDVTEVRGLARQMSYQATHDALTGLINRPELERRLAEALIGARRGDGQHLLGYLELEGLRVVNETGGSQAGDAVLREAANLLKAAVRASDTVARVGGDEFGLLLLSCPLAKGRQIIEDLCRELSRHRFSFQDRVYNIGVSAGLVEISRESGTAQETLMAADAACYVARRQGESKVLVYSARDEALARHSGEIRWLQSLADALRESRFELHQQPIVATLGREGEGPAVEVLVRLKDEGGHELPPAELLRAAERYQLLGRIDRWVVQRTLSAIARGAILLGPQRSVAINISAQTLADAQFMHFVVEALDSTGVSPAQVCFEISERAVASDPGHARRFVAVLHGMGCQFTLDDFGAHGASLTALRSLPLNYVKIDGGLVRNLVRDPVNQALVGSMIRLARSLRFKVIADQVEDPTVLEAVRNLGVDYLQGHLIGQPTPLPAGEGLAVARAVVPSREIQFTLES